MKRIFLSYILPVSFVCLAGVVHAGGAVTSPGQIKQCFALGLRRTTKVISRDYLQVGWGDPSSPMGHSVTGADCLLRVTVLDGSVIEFPFTFSGTCDSDDPSAWHWAPGEDGTRDISIETEQDLKKIQVLDATTRAVIYEENFPDPGIKPSVVAALGSQNELRMTTSKKVDRRELLFSVDQGRTWFVPNFRNAALVIVDAQGTWPIILKQPDKPQQKVWVDVLLLFGGTTVRRQYEFTQDKGLADVTGQALWVTPWPISHNPAPYW